MVQRRFRSFHAVTIGPRYRRTVPRSGDETRRQLLDAAEEHLADDGVDAAAIDRISASAGHRDSGAITEHFGGRSGLLEAVMRRRIEWIAERRAELTAELPEHPGVTELVRVIVQPLAELLSTPGGSAYLRIQAELLSTPRRFDDPLLARPWTRPGLVEVYDRIAALLPEHAVDPDDHRRELATSLVFHALADRVRAAPTEDHALFVRSLVAAVAAILEMEID